MSSNKPKSGLRSNYRIEMSNGDVLQVQTELSDVMRWESQHGGQAWVAFPMPLERQLWVAWCAARRLKLTDVKEPERWMNDVREFDEDDDDDDPAVDGDDPEAVEEANGRGPTNPAASD